MIFDFFGASLLRSLSSTWPTESLFISAIVTSSALRVALGLVMAVLDGAIANVALLTTAKDLNADSAFSIWIVNGLCPWFARRFQLGRRTDLDLCQDFERPEPEVCRGTA